MHFNENYKIVESEGFSIFTRGVKEQKAGERKEVKLESESGREDKIEWNRESKVKKGREIEIEIESKIERESKKRE